MIQVKEIINHQEGQEDDINVWLAQNRCNAKIIDIKYSVSCYPPDEKAGWNAQDFSGTLIIYKKRNIIVAKILKFLDFINFLGE